jgi:hypothetical protein
MLVLATGRSHAGLHREAASRRRIARLHAARPATTAVARCAAVHACAWCQPWPLLGGAGPRQPASGWSRRGPAVCIATRKRTPQCRSTPRRSRSRRLPGCGASAPSRPVRSCGCRLASGAVLRPAQRQEPGGLWDAAGCAGTCAAVHAATATAGKCRRAKLLRGLRVLAVVLLPRLRLSAAAGWGGLLCVACMHPQTPGPPLVARQGERAPARARRQRPFRSR